MKRLVFILAPVLCICTHAFAQEQKPRRAVIINVVSGEPIKGEFVRADETTVIVKSGVAETSVKLSDVVSIVFGEQAAAPLAEPSPTPNPDKQAAEDAIKALRRLASAAEVGVTYVEYGRIVIEAKAEVDGALAKIQDRDLKSYISRAIHEYAYASQAWNYFIQNRGGIPTKSDLGRQLITKYSIPIKISIFTSLTRDSTLPHIWRKARIYYDATIKQANSLQ
jgi:hypothetical protein